MNIITTNSIHNPLDHGSDTLTIHILHHITLTWSTRHRS